MTLRAESGRGVQCCARLGIFLGLACCVGSFLLPLWNMVYSARPCVQRPICGVAVYASHNGQESQHHSAGRSATPHGPAWAREQAWPQLSGQSSTSFPVWRAVSPTLTYHRHEGCFCECVDLIVSLDLLPFLGRGCLVKCSMQPDPFDLFHVGPVRVSKGRQQDPCIHLAGCQLFLEREVPHMAHRFCNRPQDWCHAAPPPKPAPSLQIHLPRWTAASKLGWPRSSVQWLCLTSCKR